MTPEEQDDIERDQMIPLMTTALHTAYEDALNSGYDVMIADNGALYWVHSDKSRTFIRDIAPPVTVKEGHTMIRFTTPHVQQPVE